MILVTGANGFVGRQLCAILSQRNIPFRKVVRSPHTDAVIVGEINDQTDWQSALLGVSVVVHLAARVHVMNDTSTDPLAEFRKVNVEGTLRLAEQAALANVKRFVFISSIKVNGERTLRDQPFCADDIPAPIDPYGISKEEAERRLLKLAETSSMEVVIIRPPLVYGVGVKANFFKMMSWLSRGIPLPLGAIDNQRSMVAVENLADLIITCCDHPAAANQIFLASDGEDLSTPELLRRMGDALGTPARLLPISSGLIKFLAGLLGKKDVAQRLCDSLQVDISKNRNLLGWNPPLNVDEGLYKTAQGFLHEKNV